MTNVGLVGKLIFEKSFIGVRCSVNEKYYDFERGLLTPEAQAILEKGGFRQIELYEKGDKLVSDDEEKRGYIINAFETRNKVIAQLDHELTWHQALVESKPSLPQPEKPVLQTFVITIESLELHPTTHKLQPMQLVGEFKATTRELAIEDAKDYYANELDTTPSDIKVVHVETKDEFIKRTDAENPPKPRESHAEVKDAIVNSIVVEEPTKQAKPVVKPEPTAKPKVEPKAKATGKAKAEGKAKAPKLKTYIVLLAVKTLTADGTGVDDKEIKREFEDANLTNVKMQAREAVAKEFNVPMKDVKVLKAGVKKD